MSEHRVGQLWQSGDSQWNLRTFTIVALEEERVQVRNIRGKRTHWIRRSRLKPKAYRLLRDVTA